MESLNISQTLQSLRKLQDQKVVSLSWCRLGAHRTFRIGFDVDKDTDIKMKGVKEPQNFAVTDNIPKF